MMFGTAAAQDDAALLLKELGLEETAGNAKLNVLKSAGHRYLRDLKLNVATALKAESLGIKDAYLVALAAAVNENNVLLQGSFEKSAREHGATDAEIADTISCTSLLNANNVYYRFRHFMSEEFYDKSPAGMRMSIMANPILGKELFELISLAVSAMNGCSACVRSHEATLVNHGTSKQRIHDAVRLAAVVKSLSVIVN
ncbi:MAG: carboxymuconolactone decarboxylase family protein [Flavisolibacter sp.]